MPNLGKTRTQEDFKFGWDYGLLGQGTIRKTSVQMRGLINLKF